MMQCAICTENLGKSSPIDSEYSQNHQLVLNQDGSSKVSATTCGHLFHTSCIAKWLETTTRSKQCPICNKEIIKNSIITIFADWSQNNEDNNNNEINDNLDLLNQLTQRNNQLIAENNKLKSYSMIQERDHNDLLQQLIHHQERIVYLEKEKIEKEKLKLEMKKLKHYNQSVKLKLDYLQYLDTILKFNEETQLMSNQIEFYNTFSKCSNDKKWDLFLASEKMKQEALNHCKQMEKRYELELQKKQIKLEETYQELLMMKRQLDNNNSNNQSNSSNMNNNGNNKSSRVRPNTVNYLNEMNDNESINSSSNENSFINPFVKNSKKRIKENGYYYA
ncbi:hypothetical protein K502DRAFT_323928 [Neoconidiobolus thromboides FSU 785]|nr:hypothetical protein K502DRAFT_323928 [Neoconidiobolus thromboides FSU 785]